MNKKLLLCLALISTHATHTMLVRTLSQTQRKPFTRFQHTSPKLTTNNNSPLINHESQTKPNDPVTNKIKSYILPVEEKLYDAAKNGWFDLAQKYIVESPQIKINWQNREGKTPLIAAVTSPYLHYGTAQQEIASMRTDFVYVVGLLIRNGADPYRRDCNNKHAFIYVNDAIHKLETKVYRGDDSCIIHNENRNSLALLHRIRNTLERPATLE